jgi:hypothetical protein
MEALEKVIEEALRNDVSVELLVAMVRDIKRKIRAEKPGGQIKSTKEQTSKAFE